MLLLKMRLVQLGMVDETRRDIGIRNEGLAVGVPCFVDCLGFRGILLKVAGEVEVEVAAGIGVQIV